MSPDAAGVRLTPFTEAQMRHYAGIDVEVDGAIVNSVVAESDGATFQPVTTAKTRILCLGDSITQGMNARHPVSIYTTGLGRSLDAEVLNQGVGEHVFDPASFDRRLPFDADIVTVAYGTNDRQLARSRTAHA